MSMKKLVYGVFTVILLYLSSTIAAIVLATPMLPALFIGPQLMRRFLDFLIKRWFLLCVAMNELLLGVKIVVKGKPSPPGTSSLVILNHRTRLDWLFLMSYLTRYSNIGEFRISLKYPLKHFPGAGWAMQCAGFMFLKRQWEEDKIHISNGIHYFSRVKSKPQFLLFPEGTDMCKTGMKRSDEYAEKMGLPKYQYVLHPRSRGFVHFVNEMKKGEILDSILDVTVAYPNNIIQRETEFLKGNVPQEIHFYVEDHPIDTIPTTDAELEEWLRKLWSEKEERLRRFYADKSFEQCKMDEAKSVSDGVLKRQLYEVILFWAVFLSAVFIGLMVSQAFRWYFLIACAVHVLIGIRHGGVDYVMYTAVKHHQ